MRFAKDFRQHQTLEAAAFYIAYGELKKDLKLALGSQADSAKCIKDVASDLAREYARTRTYHDSELNYVSAVLERMDDVHSQQRPSAAEGISRTHARSASKWRLQMFEAVYSALYERITQVLLFAKLNADAVLQMCTKLARSEVQVTEEKPKPMSGLALHDCSRASRIERVVKQRLSKTRDDLHSLDHSGTSDEGETDGLDLEIQQFLKSSKTDADSSSTLSWFMILAEYDIHQKTTSTDKCVDVQVVQNAWEHLILFSLRKATDSESEGSVNMYDGSFCGRSPLHFAASLGNTRVVTELLRLGYRSDKTDSTGLLPIHLAACKRRSAAVRELLPALSDAVSRGSIPAEMVSTLGRQLLMTRDVDVLREALRHVCDVNLDDSCGNNLLCEASRLQAYDAACLLLESGACPNIVEKSSGATPLGIAACIPNAAIVRLLLGKGAHVDMKDARGWTAMEHAAYRGHMDLVGMLEDSGAVFQFEALPFTTCPSRYRRDAISDHVPWLQEDIVEGAYVWITLGSIDATSQAPAVQIFADKDVKSGSSVQHPQVLYTLSVGLDDNLGKTYDRALPIFGSRLNEPYFFKVEPFENVRVRWTLSRNSLDSQKSAMGSGYTLLSPTSSGLRPDTESLVRGARTILQSCTDGSALGIVQFSYHIVTSHPPPSRLAPPTFWQFGNGIGGHRGSGKNRLAHKQLQIGENTAQSFLTAIEHGASFIEFDVQLTKDQMPVVYHDFLLSETGTDSRMQDLSFEQFEYIGQAQDLRPKQGGRSLSLGATDHKHLDALAERMTYTYFNKVNGFKANTRGQFIHERPCSLEAIFNAVPKDVSMNIELKYPMLFECDEWDMELLALRADLFASVVLDKIYEHMEGRTIVLSSFSPELCIALSTKQRTLPVFFLSKTSAPKGEMRSESIQQAVHFARSWGLPGIVTECTPLAKCPRLIHYVKSAGLAITSFGTANSDMEHAKASTFSSTYVLSG